MAKLSSEEMTQNNINYVRYEISKKIGSNPYYATSNIIQNTITDYDHFPYTRNFRGIYYKTTPNVVEREAGFRQLQNNCYRKKMPNVIEINPRHCFEAPCSVVYPCYPEYLRKYADKEELEVMLNKVCIVKQP